MKPAFELIPGAHYWAVRYSQPGLSKPYYTIVKYSNEYGEWFYEIGTEVEANIDSFDEVFPEPIKNPFLK